MQSFGTFLSDNRGLAVALALLAALVVVAILWFLYRLMFGRRLHTASGRSRQPRLGVVDAFDLDRQRQLVLVRRDNVEHLLMIGGPNDVVIESAFVRAQPSVAVPLGRDKEGLVPAPVVPMPLTPPLPESVAGPVDVPPDGDGGQSRAATPPLDLMERVERAQPVEPNDLGPLADIPAPGPVTPPVEQAPKPTEGEAPAAATDPSLARPIPSRLSPSVPQRPAGGVLPPRPPLSTLRPPAAGNGTTSPVTRPPSLLPNRPMPLNPLQRGTSAASLRRDPPAAPATEAAPPPVAAAPLPPVESQSAVATAPALPTLESKTKAAPPFTLESIESLEEEMAKLLGRPGSADKAP